MKNRIKRVKKTENTSRIFFFDFLTLHRHLLKYKRKHFMCGVPQVLDLISKATTQLIQCAQCVCVCVRWFLIHSDTIRSGVARAHAAISKFTGHSDFILYNSTYPSLILALHSASAFYISIPVILTIDVQARIPFCIAVSNIPVSSRTLNIAIATRLSPSALCSTSRDCGRALCTLHSTAHHNGWFCMHCMFIAHQKPMN